MANRRPYIVLAFFAMAMRPVQRPQRSSAAGRYQFARIRVRISWDGMRKMAYPIRNQESREREVQIQHLQGERKKSGERESRRSQDVPIQFTAREQRRHHELHLQQVEVGRGLTFIALEASRDEERKPSACWTCSDRKKGSTRPAHPMSSFIPDT
jgi:hypothetical protein